MRAYGDKPITTYIGNYKPAERRKNHFKISGWRNEPKTGSSAVWDKTYNDRISGFILGNTTQVQTVQGKNLWDKSRYPLPADIKGFAEGRTLSFSMFIEATASNTGFYRIRIDEVDAQGVIKYIVGTSIPAGSMGVSVIENYTCPSGLQSLTIRTQRYPPEADGMVTYGDFQVEAGAVATAIEPFVPTSPSIEYPSLMLNAGNCEVRSRTPQILVNGNFGNGTTGWIGMYGSIGIIGKECVYEVSELSSSARVHQTIPIVVANHIYYIAAQIKPKYATSTMLRISTYSPLVTVPAVIPNQWQKVSTCLTTTQGGVNRDIYFYHLTNTQYSIGDKVYWRNMSLVDLTEIYGAGNEPTKEWCDANIPWTDKQSSPITIPELLKIGDIADTLEYKGGDIWEHTKRVHKHVFTGTENWLKYSQTDTIYKNTYFVHLPLSILGNFTSLCNYFANAGGTAPWGTSGTNAMKIGVYADHTTQPYKYFNYYPNTTLEQFKNWVAAQHAAGTPLTVQYILAAPITIQLNLGELKTFPHYTSLTQSGNETPAGLNLSAKIIDI